MPIFCQLNLEFWWSVAKVPIWCGTWNLNLESYLIYIHQTRPAYSPILDFWLCFRDYADELQMSFRASKHLSITALLASCLAASGWSCITGPAEVGCWHGWQLPLPPPDFCKFISKPVRSDDLLTTVCPCPSPQNFKTFPRLWLYDMELCQGTIENKVCWTTNRQFLKGHQESEQCKISSIKPWGLKKRGFENPTRSCKHFNFPLNDMLLRKIKKCL